MIIATTVSNDIIVRNGPGKLLGLFLPSPDLRTSFTNDSVSYLIQTGIFLLVLAGLYLAT